MPTGSSLWQRHRWISKSTLAERTGPARFWTIQIISRFKAAALIMGLLSIWLSNPAQLTSAGVF